MLKKILLLAALLCFAGNTPANSHEIMSKTFTYTDGERTFEGYLAHPHGQETPLPAVLVIHQWTGPTAHERDVADKLAALGHVAMVADVYGIGIRPTPGAEAGAESSKYRNDRDLLRQRLHLALNELRENPMVKADKVAVIGYCFGGMAALELARDGAPVVGAVSFHGNLNTGKEETDPITAKVLVLHGAADPLVPISQVAAFSDEMHARQADWQLIAYGGAKHSFTEPGADALGMDAVGYDPDADRRSWAAMKTFLGEVFGE